MSLVGFKARNHPQQQAKASVDDRGTTPEVFAPLHERFRFTVDVCATPANAKLERFYTAEDDGLARDWAGERVWCNPPYSNIVAWVEKAATSGAELVVMLLPANRTEQKWWQHYIEPHRDSGDGPRVEFLPGRMRFIVPPADAVMPNERPPFGCCLVIWGKKASRCLHGFNDADRACPDCHPPSDPATLQALLAAERERVARLERELEYEAVIANREFWATVRP